MPTSREIVSNRPLSGTELKILLREAFDRMLDNDGMLAAHIAYGRIAFTITLHKQLDGMIRAEDSRTESRPAATNVIADRPELAALSSPPLAPSPTAVTSGTRATRDITSPNAERVRAGLPVTIQRREQDGTLVSEEIKYPPDAEIADGLVLEDATGEARAAFGVPEPVATVQMRDESLDAEDPT